MKKFTVMLSLVALLLASAPVLAQPAEAPADESAAQSQTPDGQEYNRVQISLNYWPASYAGTFRFEDVDVYGGTATVVGQEVDLVDELGLENPQNIYEVEGRINLNEKHQLMLSWFSVDYGGKQRLDSKVEMGGYTFAPATDIETTFKINRFKFMYAYSPLVGEAGKLGFMVGANYFIWEVGFKGTEVTSGLQVDESEILPILVPVVGITGALNLPYGFGLHASYSGLGFAIEEFVASYSDFEAGLTYDYKVLHVGLGYRMVASRLRAETDVDDTTDKNATAVTEYNTTQDGILLTVGVNF